jgi:ribosome-associated heat shock protein Hsp15
LPASEASDTRQRLDKWLWIARVVKTREAAAALVEAGHVRINGQKTLKPGHAVKTGDVLTLVLKSRVRVLHIEAMGERRGPAETARGLYREAGATGPQVHRT